MTTASRPAGRDALVDGDAAPGADDVWADAPRRSRPARWRGVVHLVVGVGCLVLGTAGLARSDDTTLRVALVAVGLYSCYRGVALLGRALIDPDWDAGLWIAVSWLAAVVGAALLAPLLPLGEHRNSAATLTEPILARPDLLSAHPLGTNNLGLDQLARVVYGARSSLLIAFGAVLFGLVVGGAIGLVAGARRGVVDSLVGIGTNALLAFPPLVLLLALAAVLPRSTRNMSLALGILAVPVNIRLARAATLATSQEEYVLAAEGLGARRGRILLREYLPSVVPTLFSYGLIVFAVMIVAEASLSYLGLGIQQPQPSWGNMIAEGEGGVFERHPFVVLVPGAVMFLTVYGFNVVGERVRAHFDARRIEL